MKARHESILDNLNHDPDSIALSMGDQTVSYGQLPILVEERARKLEKVSVLALALDNSIDWVLWDLACQVAGVICVPLPHFFTREQRDHSIKTAGVSHIISSGGLLATQQRATKKIPQGTAKITYTSGTTGSPKGVCLPLAAMKKVAESIVGVLGQNLVSNNFSGTHACVLPLAVLLENIAGVYAGLLAGYRIELCGLGCFENNYQDLHPFLKSTRASSVILVPELLRFLIQQVIKKGPLETLKFIAVGGSKIDPELLAQAADMGLPVYQGYGLSECASVVCLNTPENNQIGSVGKLLTHVKAKVVNGELIVIKPGFLGYVGDDSDGSTNIFATGDLGEIDDQHFLQINGRKKNILITSYGRNVSPEWVESIFLAQIEIMQVVVFGDADPQLSALIVPTNREADIGAVLDRVNEKLPDYARVGTFHRVEPFTVKNKQLTGTGRPRRQFILDQYSHLLTTQKSRYRYDIL
ncbi:MAG: long-chain acyl-CoA synthetase [Cellvibrionaceae bacterium]|jgi:long-chain acyl-CoA synthetase